MLQIGKLTKVSGMKVMLLDAMQVGHSPTQSLTHSVTHSLTHSLTHPLSYPSFDSFIHPLITTSLALISPVLIATVSTHHTTIHIDSRTAIDVPTNTQRYSLQVVRNCNKGTAGACVGIVAPPAHLTAALCFTTSERSASCTHALGMARQMGHQATRGRALRHPFRHQGGSSGPAHLHPQAHVVCRHRLRPAGVSEAE